MGQVKSCDNLHENVGFLQDELVRNARIITEIATLKYHDLQSYLGEVNNLSKKCMDAEGKQLAFLIRKGSDEGFFWKNTIRIACVKYFPDQMKVVTVKLMTLNQFLRVYRSLKLQFKAAEKTTLEQGEEATSGDDFDTAVLMKDIDVAVGGTTECCICFERPHEILLPCFHSFCQLCIQNWKVNHKTCPICRETIDNEKDSWVIFDVPSGFEIEKELVTSMMDVMKTDSAVSSE